MHGLLSLYLVGGFVLAGIVVLSFILWFQLRERPGWDTGLFLAASAAMAILVAMTLLLGPMAVMMSLSLVPGLLVYLWFGALRSSRRRRAAILRWGARNGYVITSVERTTVLDGTTGRLQPEYRIVVRRQKDGAIRIGRVLFAYPSRSGQGFDVVWES
jgi:hypothetical protein